MARSHARLLLTIWADREWRALPMAAQWLYEAVISQPDINHAGVVTLAERRWAGLAADTDRAIIEAGVKVLAERRFFVVDDNTEELLVRSFIRNDQVDRQPNTLKSALRSALAVQSPLIRAALHAELQRLDLARISQMRAPRGHDPVGPMLIAAIAGLAPDPSTPPPGIPVVTPSEGYGVGYREPYDEPIGVPPGEGEGESSYVTAEINSTHTARTPNVTSPPRTRAHTREAVRLVQAYAATCRLPPHRSVLDGLAQRVDELLGAGWPAADVEIAIDAWAAKGLGPALLPSVANDVANRRPSQRTVTPSTTDRRVAQALAFGERWADGPPDLRALPGGAL